MEKNNSISLSSPSAISRNLESKTRSCCYLISSPNADDDQHIANPSVKLPEFNSIGSLRAAFIHSVQEMTQTLVRTLIRQKTR